MRDSFASRSFPAKMTVCRNDIVSDCELQGGASTYIVDKRISLTTRHVDGRELSKESGGSEDGRNVEIGMKIWSVSWTDVEQRHCSTLSWRLSASSRVMNEGRADHWRRDDSIAEESGSTRHGQPRLERSFPRRLRQHLLSCSSDLIRQLDLILRIRRIPVNYSLLHTFVLLRFRQEWVAEVRLVISKLLLCRTRLPSDESSSPRASSSSNSRSHNVGYDGKRRTMVEMVLVAED